MERTLLCSCKIYKSQIYILLWVPYWLIVQKNFPFFVLISVVDKARVSSTCLLLGSTITEDLLYSNSSGLKFSTVFWTIVSYVRNLCYGVIPSYGKTKSFTVSMTSTVLSHTLNVDHRDLYRLTILLDLFREKFHFKFYVVLDFKKKGDPTLKSHKEPQSTKGWGQKTSLSIEQGT